MADWVGACTATLAPLIELIRRPCARRRAAARRRHHRAGAGQGQDHHRPGLDLCPRRPALWRAGTAGGAVPLLARPRRRAPEPASGRLCRHPAGRRLCRVRRALRGGAQARADHRGGVLGPWPAQVLRAGRLSRKAPLAIEAVRRIDAIFDAERAINGLPAEARLAVRQQHIAPLVAELETWMRDEPRQAVPAQPESPRRWTTC